MVVILLYLLYVMYIMSSLALYTIDLDLVSDKLGRPYRGSTFDLVV